MKYYLSDDLASDSERQTLREAAFNKKKREANKHKDRKKQFRNAYGYIMFFTSIPLPYLLQIINLVYDTLNLYHKLLQNYWK